MAYQKKFDSDSQDTLRQLRQHSVTRSNGFYHQSIMMKGFMTFTKNLTFGYLVRLHLEFFPASKLTTSSVVCHKQQFHPQADDGNQAFVKGVLEDL
ncbi:MAG: hypothetical protein AB2708_04480 [Candidatus Thiodiazotropha taylori]